MKKISFLSSLDGIVRQHIPDRNQILFLMAIDDMLQYISGEPMEFGLGDFVQKDHEKWGYREGRSFRWCGVDKMPYGFTIKAFQGYILDVQEMASLLWETLYQMDGNGNEAMEEGEGIEYAMNAYESPDIKALRKKYQGLGDMLADCEIIGCTYEVHGEIFSYAHNVGEALILLELIINSGGDVHNECGCLEKHILSLESPALDAWMEFMASGGNKVAKEDATRFRIILDRLENEEITYGTANAGVELSSFSTGVGYPGGWYRTIIHDTYCFYNSYGVKTSHFFVYGLISLRYLALMLEMQDFLGEMDGKYHYLACRGDRGEAGI